MSYDWVGHVKSVAHFLKRDGSGFTNKLYAEDAAGNILERCSDPRAVKYSLIGINHYLIWQHANHIGGDIKTVTDRAIGLLKVSVKLWERAGVPVHDVRTDVYTMGLLRFGRDNAWPEIEKVLRQAYTIAKTAKETQRCR